MQAFLDDIRKEYELKIGDFEFSPVMECTIGLAMRHIEKFKSTSNRRIFTFCFPRKDYSCVWLSVALLRNFFLEDYVLQTENRIKDLKINSGSYVEIFGCVSKYLGQDEKVIRLSFKDGVFFNISKGFLPYVNRTHRKSLNNYKHFVEEKKRVLSNRSAVSRLLEPKAEVAINRKILTSKILLIVGSGNANSIRSSLKTTRVYEESLSTIFGVDSNIIIKQSLESFKNYFDPNIQEAYQNFGALLLASCNRIQSSQTDKSGILIRIVNELENGNLQTEDFSKMFYEFLETFDESEFPFLTRVKSIYPGVREPLPDNLRAIIINDFDQLLIYENTLNSFSREGIPVILIADRKYRTSDSAAYFKDVFGIGGNSYRINWNRDKIQALEEIRNSGCNKYLDHSLWLSCIRFSKQIIRVRIFEQRSLDILLPKVIKIFKEIEGYEILKRKFYQFLYPAAFAVKNSAFSNSNIIELIREFESEFSLIKNLLNSESAHTIADCIEAVKDPINNSKVFVENENTFSHLVNVVGFKPIYIPTNSKRINLPDCNCESIVFTGFPYNEYFGKYLMNAICSEYVENISLLCWPIEADMAFKYIYKRLLMGYFTDDLDNIKFPSKYLLSEENLFDRDIRSFLITEKTNLWGDYSVEPDVENDLEEISNYRYKQYQARSTGENSYVVPCNLINFSDGSFMFLPPKSKILADIEDIKNEHKFKNLIFQELKVGQRIFKYRKDRSNLRLLSGSNTEAKFAFRELVRWKHALLDLYKQNEGDVIKLESSLKEVENSNRYGGSINKTNIQRWLFDEEIIAPEIGNIKVILKAHGEENVESISTKVNAAYLIIFSLSISLSSQIKRSIASALEQQNDKIFESFTIAVDKYEIEVESRLIASLETNILEVEYSDTRKILY
jgi:hypothetical protein